MGKIDSYRDLQVWQERMELAKDMYVLCEALPRKEQYGLISQMQRAVVSVPSNISEGHNRHSTKEYMYFLRIALGSLAEIETQLLLSAKLSYVTEDNIIPLLKRSDSIGKMLRTILQKLHIKVE